MHVARHAARASSSLISPVASERTRRAARLAGTSMRQVLPRCARWEPVWGATRLRFGRSPPPGPSVVCLARKAARRTTTVAMGEEPETRVRDDAAFRHLRQPAPAPQTWLLVHYAAQVAAFAIEDGQTLTVGRRKPCDIVLDEPTLSRKHASIERTGNQILDRGPRLSERHGDQRDASARSRPHRAGGRGAPR